MARARSTGITALAVAAALTGAALPATAEATTITGKTSNRHGTLALRFTTDPGTMRLELGGKVRKTSRGKRIGVECRDGDRYVRVLSVLIGVTSRFIGGPVSAPVGTDRCRVRRDGKIIGTMRMRTAG